MAKLYNLARMTTATTGTGTITLGSAVSGYLTFALSGVANADVVSYAIKDGANSEIGTAPYTSAGTLLGPRTVTKSTNANAAISLSGTAEVLITPRAEDLPTARPKVITFTFDTSLSTNFAITGVGFAPKAAFFFAALPAVQNVVSWGTTDGTSSYELHGRGSTASIPNYGIDTVGTSALALVTVAGTTAITVGLVSLDADGVTFSRSLTGSPSGTATAFALMFS